jgi:hypothetical protein
VYPNQLHQFEFPTKAYGSLILATSYDSAIKKNYRFSTTNLTATGRRSQGIVATCCSGCRGQAFTRWSWSAAKAKGAASAWTTGDASTTARSRVTTNASTTAATGSTGMGTKLEPELDARTPSMASLQPPLGEAMPDADLGLVVPSSGGARHVHNAVGLTADGHAAPDPRAPVEPVEGEGRDLFDVED